MFHTFLLVPRHIQFGVTVTQAIVNDRPPRAKKVTNINRKT